MSTTISNPTRPAASGALGRIWMAAAVALLAAAVAGFAVASLQSGGATSQGPVDPAIEAGLTDQQIVIRGEVAERYAPRELTDRQIVIRGEVAERYAPSGPEVLQAVIRGEVADRYATK